MTTKVKMTGLTDANAEAVAKFHNTLWDLAQTLPPEIQCEIELGSAAQARLAQKLWDESNKIRWGSK